MSLRNTLAGAAADAKQKKAAFNSTKTRYIAPGLFGWTCYAGEVRDGDFRGVRMGVLQDDARAREWLEDTAQWESYRFDDGGQA